MYFIVDKRIFLLSAKWFGAHVGTSVTSFLNDSSCIL